MFSYSNVSLWYSQGQLHNILGIQPGSHGAILRGACKLARLKTHPDKGGDADVFKLVEETIKILLNDLPEASSSELYQPIWLNRLCQQINRCRFAFGRGCGNIEQIQRLREEYKRMFHEYQQRVEAEEARRVQEQMRREQQAAASQRRAREHQERIDRHQERIDRHNKQEEENALREVLENAFLEKLPLAFRHYPKHYL